MFQYNDLCTLYSSDGDVERNFGSDCCFHYVTKDEMQKEMNNKYTIRLIRDSNFSERDRRNNYCPFPIEVIEKHLKFINRIYPITYSIREYNGNVYNYTEEEIDRIVDEDEDVDREYLDINYPAFDLDIEINGALIYHKFVLKLIRILYEFPFNMMFSDILKMKTLVPDLYKLGFLNLYCYLGYLFKQTDFGLISDQFICNVNVQSRNYIDIVNFISLGNLKEKMKELSILNCEEQDICDKLMSYKRYDINLTQFIRDISFYDVFGSAHIYSMDFWNNDQEFLNRCTIYRKFINKILNNE